MIPAQPPDWLCGCIFGGVVVFLFWYYGPQESANPPSDSPAVDNTLYDEATIVSKINEIYRLLTRLSYIPAGSIAYLPPSGHQINETLCADLCIDPLVVSLMKRLPYPINPEVSSTFELIPQARAAVYTNDEELKFGRGSPKSTAEILLQSQDIILVRAPGSTTAGSLVLDTRNNTIRSILQRANSDPKSGKQPNAAIFVQPVHAPAALSQLADRFRSLEWLPWGIEGNMHIAVGGDPGYEKAKNILENGYDWPHAFREEDWSRHHQRIWRECTLSNYSH